MLEDGKKVDNIVYVFAYATDTKGKVSSTKTIVV